MVIFGRNYEFAATVWATRKIAELCPGNDIRSIDEYLYGKDAAAQDDLQTIDKILKIICILSEAAESKKAFEDLSYKRSPLTEEMLSALDYATLGKVQTEAFEAFRRDSETHVELASDAEDEKKTTPIRMN